MTDANHTTVALPGNEAPDSSTRIPTLVVVEGPHLGGFYRFPMDRRSVHVGREQADDVDIVLPDPSVSRRHARFFWGEDQGQRAVFVEDSESTNGVQVNGESQHRKRLRSGDKVRFGKSLLRFALMDGQDLAYEEELRRRVEAGVRDPLTACLTRGALESLIRAHLETHDAGGPAPACILVDLDLFKNINDKLGHNAGDAVLKAAGAALQDTVRDRDHVCRWGGEEFLAVLPGTDAGASADVAKRMQSAIRKLRFDDWQELRVTASFGVASRLPDEDVIDWVERADKALYAAKQQGRDCIRKATFAGPAVP